MLASSSGRSHVQCGYSGDKILDPPSVPSDFPTAVAQPGSIVSRAFYYIVQRGANTCGYLPVHSSQFFVGRESKEILHQLPYVD